MISIKFDREKHAAMTDSWCIERDMSVFPEGWLPDTGYIVEDVLAAFLYKTNSGCCWMENVISNPVTSKEERAEALLLVTKDITDEAIRGGFKYLLGFSAIHTVVATAEKLGFEVSKDPYFTLIKPLEKMR